MSAGNKQNKNLWQHKNSRMFLYSLAIFRYTLRYVVIPAALSAHNGRVNKIHKSFKLKPRLVRPRASATPELKIRQRTVQETGFYFSIDERCLLGVVHPTKRRFVWPRSERLLGGIRKVFEQTLYTRAKWFGWAHSLTRSTSRRRVFCFRIIPLLVSRDSHLVCAVLVENYGAQHLSWVCALLLYYYECSHEIARCTIGCTPP